MDLDEFGWGGVCGVDQLDHIVGVVNAVMNLRGSGATELVC
jgi:hypothetical protein